MNLGIIPKSTEIIDIQKRSQVNLQSINEVYKYIFFIWDALLYFL